MCHEQCCCLITNIRNGSNTGDIVENLSDTLIIFITRLFRMNIFLQVILHALLTLGFYLVRSVRANICRRLLLQPVGTSFINKLPLHSSPTPHLTQLLAGINFKSPFMALLSMGPLSHQERASSAIRSLERPHLQR